MQVLKPITTLLLSTHYLSMMPQVCMANAISIGRTTTAATELKDHTYANTEAQQLYRREDPPCCICITSGSNKCDDSCCE